MNNRRRQRIRTSLKISEIKFLKMSEEEQDEHINKFWEKFNIMKKEKENEVI